MIKLETARNHVQTISWIWKARKINWKLKLYFVFMHADVWTAAWILRILYWSCSHFSTVWPESPAGSLNDLDRNPIDYSVDWTAIEGTVQKTVWMFRNTVFRIFMVFLQFCTMHYQFMWSIAFSKIQHDFCTARLIVGWISHYSAWLGISK